MAGRQRMAAGAGDVASRQFSAHPVVSPLDVILLLVPFVGRVTARLSRVAARQPGAARGEGEAAAMAGLLAV